LFFGRKYYQFQLKMLSFILFLNVCAIIQVLRVESHTPHRDRYLDGRVIERLNTVEWMQCLIACTTTNDCVSYKFEPRSGTCQLLSEGIDLGSNCNGRTFLVRSQGWIFHQITETFWSSWSQWTRCADYTFNERQTRKRACISPSNGGCSGEEMQIRGLDKYGDTTTVEDTDQTEGWKTYFVTTQTSADLSLSILSTSLHLVANVHCWTRHKLLHINQS